MERIQELAVDFHPVPQPLGHAQSPSWRVHKEVCEGASSALLGSCLACHTQPTRASESAHFIAYVGLVVRE